MNSLRIQLPSFFIIFIGLGNVSTGLQAEPGSHLQPTGKPRVIVLGTGWGSISFLKALSKKQVEMYDFIVISPRNYFLYTPLLPAVATGTMEERSIVEPIRNVLVGKGEYYEAICQVRLPHADVSAKQKYCTK